MRKAQMSLAIALIFCLTSLSANSFAIEKSGDGGGGISFRDYKPLEEISAASSGALSLPEFTTATSYLTARGFKLNNKKAMHAAPENSNQEAFVFPIKGRSTSMIDSIALTSASSTDVDAAEYNTKYSAQNVKENVRWMIYINQPDFPLVFFVESIKFASNDTVFVLTSPGSGKLVINLGEDILYTLDAPQGGDFSTAVFNPTRFWNCIKQVLGISSATSITVALKNICQFSDKAKAIIALAGGCLGISFGCITGIIGFLACAGEEFARCYRQSR